MTLADKENKELCKLININEDACEFYESAREKAEDPRLKATFRELEDMHKGVVVNLQQHVRAHGGKAEAEETMVGQMAQFWGELMASISNDVNETLVSHLEEAEDRCLHSMRNAMESQDILPETKIILRRELDALTKSHNYMKTLKERMKAA